jgi:hypothetical protein
MKEKKANEKKLEVMVSCNLTKEDYKKLLSIKGKDETLSGFLRKIIKEKLEEAEKLKETGVKQVKKTEVKQEKKNKEQPQVEVKQEGKIEETATVNEQPQVVETKKQDETVSDKVTLTIADNIKVSCANCKYIKNMFSFWKCEKYDVTMNIAVVYRCKDFEPRE